MSGIMVRGKVAEGKLCGTMRELIALLESSGKLHRVKKAVDPSWEIACMARWVYQGFSMPDRFGLLFENVKGSPMSVATPVIGASRDTYAMAMGTTPDQIHGRWLQALRNPLDPVVVETAPVQEVIIEKDGIDLSQLPVPVWTPGKDKSPCITALVFTRNDESGVQNIGTYRCQVQSKSRITLNTNPGRQAFQNYQSYAQKGRPAPIAVVLSCEPAVHLAAAGALPKGLDEITVAGGIKGAPIEMVQAKTSELLVPASAEIVVEGLIDPEGRMTEHAFGEFAGYMGSTAPRPFFDVHCITHRPNPIYYGYISQHPPSESTLIQGQANECVIHKMLVDDWGEITVRDVAMNQTHGGLMGLIVVQMKPTFRGHARHVGRKVAEMGVFFKTIMVVDEDIDIRHQQHLDLVINSRVNPQRDLVVITDVFQPYDPSSEQGIGSQLVIDATHKGTYPDLSLPSKERFYQGYESWREAGLPAFDVPDWMDRLLDYHEERMKRQGGEDEEMTSWT